VSIYLPDVPSCYVSNLSSTADPVSSSSVLASSFNVLSDSILAQSVDVPLVLLDESIIVSSPVSSQSCYDSLPPQPSIESALEDLQTSLHSSPSTENITKVDILLPFTPVHLPTFKWDDIDGCIMSDIIDKIMTKLYTGKETFSKYLQVKLVKLLCTKFLDSLMLLPMLQPSRQ
jgi:hypothetical protein